MMPPRSFMASLPKMMSTSGGVGPTYMNRVSVGAPHWSCRGTSTMVSKAVCPPMPSNQIGCGTFCDAHAGSTRCGAIMETSQNESGPTVTRAPEGRKLLNTPTLPLAPAPGHALPLGCWSGFGR